MTILYMLYTVACVQIHAVTVPFFNRNFIEEGLTFLASQEYPWSVLLWERNFTLFYCAVHVSQY